MAGGGKGRSGDASVGGGRVNPCGGSAIGNWGVISGGFAANGRAKL